MVRLLFFAFFSFPLFDKTTDHPVNVPEIFFGLDRIGPVEFFSFRGLVFSLHDNVSVPTFMKQATFRS